MRSFTSQTQVLNYFFLATTFLVDFAAVLAAVLGFALAADLVAGFGSASADPAADSFLLNWLLSLAALLA